MRNLKNTYLLLYVFLIFTLLVLWNKDLCGVFYTNFLEAPAPMIDYSSPNISTVDTFSTLNRNNCFDPLFIHSPYNLELIKNQQENGCSNKMKRKTIRLIRNGTHVGVLYNDSRCYLRCSR